MYTLLLLLWAWPIWLVSIVTLLLKANLTSPYAFFFQGLVVCFVLEVALAFGFLQVIVVPLMSLSGLLVHVLFGLAGCLLVYRYQPRKISIDNS